MTKSDWFIVANATKTRVWHLEIFGVNPDKGTKHCMRLLDNGDEVEIFHLDDLSSIARYYHLDIIALVGHEPTTWLLLNKQTLISKSKQLKNEGLGQKNQTTEQLIRILKKRKSNE
ncbi:MAG: hypothetical protein ACLFUH_00905 [Bacteroidales bacterium]